MKDFIEKIEKIGFKEDNFFQRRYKYGFWRIDINPDCWWHLTYSDANPDPLKRVEITHEFIKFDDKDILNKYFTPELREIVLNQLGIK